MYNSSYVKYRSETIKRCQKFFKKTAITYMRDNGQITKTTFEQMLKGFDMMTMLMEDIGVVSGDRVAVISPHSPQSVLAALGLAYTNITTVLIDASLPISEINRLLSYSDVQACFTTDKLYGGIQKELQQEIPFLKLSEKENEYCLFEDSVSKTQKPKTIDPEKDVIAILFSSGTTAQMKGIKVTYESVMKASEIFIRNVEWKAEYSYLHVFPLNHIAGYATVQSFLSCGSELGMIENMNATKLQETLLKYQPHGFGMIPKVFEMMEDKIRLSLKQKGVVVEKAVLLLMELSSFLRRNFGCMVGRKWFHFLTKQVFGENIVSIGTGAALCRPSTSKFFWDLGLYWTNNYASTETNVPATSTGNFDKYPVAIAGYAKRNPEIDIKINTPDEHGVGEIYIKSELLMKGYFRDDELTRQSYDGEYFKTGDYGYIDKKGNLYVTGRVKESILLHSGKKVSPTDVENFYKTTCGDVVFACCGYAKKDSNYDEIHLFVQTKGKMREEIERLVQNIYEVSNKAANIYRLSAVHKLETIPMTSVGKVKRYELQQYIKGEVVLGNVSEQKLSNEEKHKQPVEFVVVELIKQALTINTEVSLESDIHTDLGLDSLKVLELDMQIQSVYEISVVNEWLNIKTVSDLVQYIKDNMHITQIKDQDHYPEEKTKEDIQRLKTVVSSMEEFCDFEYIGLENIPDTPCVFAANHSSHLDTISVYGALLEKDEKRIEKMCCLAAKELAESPDFKMFFKSIGAIPIDRKVNSAAVLKSVQKCITEREYSALIYPEGTRARTGKMGEFLDGTAIICVKTGVPVVPIGIQGAFEVWPPQSDNPKKLPQKPKIIIRFGVSIDSKDCSIKQLTTKLKKAVVELCEDKS